MENKQIKLGYNDDRTEYYSPYLVTIYHENIDFHWLIASTAQSTQSLCLPDIPLNTIGNLANKFEYFTPTVIVLSSRFSAENFASLRERGFARIYALTSQFEKVDDVQYLDYEEIISHVKLTGNAYILFEQYLAIHHRTGEFAAIAQKLKYFKRGLTLTGESYPEMLKDICGKLQFSFMYDNIVARGQAYYDIVNMRASEQISAARIIAKSDTLKIAIIYTDEFTMQATADHAKICPEIAQCPCVIYARFSIQLNMWDLLAETTLGVSAVDIMRSMYSNAVGSNFSANCLVSDLSPVFVSN